MVRPGDPFASRAFTYRRVRLYSGRGDEFAAAANTEGVDVGLDNMPSRVPCKYAGTAVEREGVLDCDETITRGGCPWVAAWEAGGKPAGMARGILGTYCWFRGAVGSQFLEVLQRAGYSPPENGFYGDGDGPDLSPEYCTELAAWLADHAEAFSAQLFLELRADMNEHEARSTAKQGMETYAYAVWWLHWAASEGGADAWW